ncbi:MAG: TonB-dependent receptor plug domain-containing protein [Opitutales bacterium]|nr:TonB-dependent receptor plug domain-containing protein [Opitutales bacterium]MBT5170331.1 TonB-dependent receptor plug domain-containing protein [Opitutales bacterium]MBT5815365.1 TonB-dependent receptor plug domain-containing protein [Opitutales bacterium]
MNHLSYTRKFKPVMCFLAAGVTILASVQSQDDDEEFDEIFELSPFSVDVSDDSGYRATNTISGTRLNTAIKDIPMPIEVITDEFIKDTGATDLRDALQYSAGIVLQSQNDAGKGNSTSTVGGVHNPEGATSNKSNTSYKVRGFLTDSTLRDGYRRQFFTDSANIGRIEVIRGPAALLYGIGNFGGIVNYLPKLPPAEGAQDFTLSMGNRGHRRATHSIGGPLGGPWDLRFNLTSAYEENGSHTELRSDEHFFISPIFTMKPTEKTDLTFDFEYGKRQDDGVGFQSLRARANIPDDQQDRLERAGFITFPGKDIKTFRWSGPDTFVDTETSNMRIQATHQFSDNFNVLVGLNESNVKFDIRDINGSIQTNAGPESLRSTIVVTPADVVNGDSEFEAGPITGAIFRGTWADKAEVIDRQQVRVEASYSFDAFPNNDNFGFTNSFLLGHSEEKSQTNIFKRSTIANEYTWKDPTDSSYIRFGENGDGSAAPGMEDFSGDDNTAWNQGTYLVHQGGFWKDRITTVAGIRRDRNAINTITNDYVGDTVLESRPGASEKDTMQLGLSFKVNKNISVYALQSDGIMPNFEGNKDVYGEAMEAVTAESEEVGIKFDLMDGKLSGTISAYRIKQSGTPIFYWWAPTPAKTKWDASSPIVYNVSDFNPTVEADWRNGALTAAKPQWDSAVSSGAAYQIEETWYVNATESAGADYLDAVFDATKTTHPGWPGWLYNYDENTNHAGMNFAGQEHDGWDAYVSGDQESSGWEGQFNFAPTDNIQFVLNYAQTKRQVVNAGQFADMYGDGPVDRWAIWYFPDGGWGLSGYSLEEQYTDPNDTSTWQSRGYGGGEAQDDTPRHAASFWSNYTVNEGPLSGMSFGLGGNWESPREYFSGITDGSGQLVTDGEGQRVILTTKERFNFDGMVRYPFKFKDRDAHVQLNVYNMLGDKDPYGFIYATGTAWTMQMGMSF